MADLNDQQSSLTTKITGANTSGLETTYVKVSLNQDIGVSDIANTAGVYGQLSVGTSAVELKVGGSSLSERKLVTMDNSSNATIYWGYNNSVTTTTYAGRIFKDQQASWNFGANISIYLIAGSAGNIIRISEAS